MNYTKESLQGSFARRHLSAALVAVALALCETLGAPQIQAAPSSDAHFGTLAPNSNLLSDQQCAAAIPRTPEIKLTNTPCNHTEPNSGELALFHEHPVFGSNPPPSDFARVNGRYSGSTDMILRWAACKWGIDEDVVRAQAWTESKWTQCGPAPHDGAGDKRFSPAQCIQGNFTALWNYRCFNCCYQSWGILQTKVFYEWATWPMIKDSTAFNADYRCADQRACMNGDYAGYFASARQQPNTYSSDIASGDVDRILWGCIGMHFSGRWYDSAALPYIYEVKGYFSSKPWLRQER
jgi:hypothetical protein